MRKKTFIPLMSALLFGIFFSGKTPPVGEPEIKYLPLGDSYTICTGATEQTSWPKILADHLSKEKIKTTLLSNPARNGFSTQNLIDAELPVLEKSEANFVTLLIGVNDWVRGVDKNTFEKNYEKIIEAIQKKLGANKNKILLITIPDFGVTATGKKYSGGRNISEGIKEFNAVIKSFSKKYQLPVVDVYPVSLAMKTDTSLVAADGLHPSAKEYAAWEKIIFPAAKKLLGK